MFGITLRVTQIPPAIEIAGSLCGFLWMDFTETLARAEYALELTAGCPDLRVALLRDELMQRIPLLKEFP